MSQSFPIAPWLAGYRPPWLRADVLAGLTVAAMLVPQAMAYAELGGLPPSAGFRAALVALPVYAILGTSRHLGIGPEPGTAVLSALAVAPLAGGDPATVAERSTFTADGMPGHVVALDGSYKSGGGRPMGGDGEILEGYRLVGVVVEGEARAYRLGDLNDREVVDDTVAGAHLAVTY